MNVQQPCLEQLNGLVSQYWQRNVTLSPLKVALQVDEDFLHVECASYRKLEQLMVVQECVAATINRIGADAAEAS